MGGEARLLRSPHQPRTREPRALGLRKQTGHAGRRARAKRHLAGLRHPRGAKAQAAVGLLPIEGPTLPGPRGSLHAIARLLLPRFLPRAPAKVCPAAACRREGPPSERRGVAAPPGQMTRQGWG